MTERPQPLMATSMSWIPVILICKEHMDQLAEDGSSNDMDHYIYEKVMEAVYGPDVWDWVNQEMGRIDQVMAGS